MLWGARFDLKKLTIHKIHRCRQWSAKTFSSDMSLTPTSNQHASHQGWGGGREATVAKRLAYSKWLISDCWARVNARERSPSSEDNRFGGRAKGKLLGYDKDAEFFLGVMEAIRSMHIEEKSNRVDERERKNLSAPCTSSVANSQTVGLWIEFQLVQKQCIFFLKGNTWYTAIFI